MPATAAKAKIADLKRAAVQPEEDAPIRLTPRLPYRPNTPLAKIRQVVRQVVQSDKARP